MSTTAHAKLEAENADLRAQITAMQDALTTERAEVAKERAEYERELRALALEIAKFEEERRLDRARRFGASSEAGDHQYRLFDEAESHAQSVDESADDNTQDVPTTKPIKRRGKRQPLPANLPRVVVTHEPETTTCGCGHEMSVIGEKISEQLDVIPAQVYVIETHRPTLSCSRCDESIKTVPMPPQPIPKSIASPGLLAHVAVAKYSDGLPLYRQTKQFYRGGIDLPRNTLASHMLRTGELLQPLVDAMHNHVLEYDVLQMDETTVQVLKEPGKVAQSKSYMWVMKGGPPDQPAVLYDYATSRSKDVPDRLLAGYAGHLQTDGYAGYNKVLAREGITGLGCWAHARRKFVEAQKALPKAKQNKGTKVQQALAWISKLYQIERAIADKPPDERSQRRQQDSAKVLQQFKVWLDKQSVPPQSLLGKAITYTLGQWPRLVIYLEDERLNIDNNGVENAIRPFAVGRKNWLFSDSQSGANASANLYSVLETARANELNDYAYLKLVLTELPKLKDASLNRLLPWNVTEEELRSQLEPLR